MQHEIKLPDSAAELPGIFSNAYFVQIAGETVRLNFADNQGAGLSVHTHIVLSPADAKDLAELILRLLGQKS